MSIKNQKRSSKKEPFFLMTVKTLLAILLFTGMGVIVIGGGYIILENCKVLDNRPVFFEKQVFLTTDKTEYQTGEEVKLTVRNNLDKGIQIYNVAVERFNGVKWMDVRYDIECPCLTYCEKELPLIIKVSDNKIYNWDQLDFNCQLSENGKYRFAVKSELNTGMDNYGAEIIIYEPSISYSNEFIIKSNLVEIGVVDYCSEDNDCEARFSHCNCKYNCVNRNIEVDDCTVECNVSGPILPMCVCENNKCVEKSLGSGELSTEDIIIFLIQQMGDDNVSQEIKNAIPEKLYDYGKEAIPCLIEALDDERVFDSCYVGPSGMLRFSNDECNQQFLVNSKCMEIIKGIITPSPYPKCASHNKVYRFYYQVDNWQQWWNENQDKSLNEIRKMVRDYYRAKEEENNYPATGYRGEEYDYLDIAGDLEHDDFLLKFEEVCTGFDNLEQVDYLKWPIKCGCLNASKHSCYRHFAEYNKDASVCDKITWDVFGRDNCYWAVAIELNKARMNDKIDFCGKIEDVGIENHARQKACFELAK
ncbi:MAG: hypothetical protein KAQ87_03965 [Candidatus Pacebacteria bacterium]|nr:hypothetical protein [Candidatus Paceibacterota bacterium]